MHHFQIYRAPFEAYTLEGEKDNPVVKHPNPSNVPEFLIDYFFDAANYRLAFSDLQPGQAQFTHQIIKMVKGCFLYGLFKRKEHWFIPKITSILAWPRDAISDDAHRIATAIKHEALDILQRYLDMQDNTLLAAEFEKLSKPDQWNRTTLQSKWEQAANEVRNSFSFFRMLYLG